MTNRELELIAARGRRLGMDMVFRAASGHIGGSLSAMDILTELYFEELRIDPARPQAPERDRFVMSKGHCTPALYSVLALRGYFPEKELELFRSIEGHMSGHPDMVHVPGVDMSTAPWARVSPPPWAWRSPRSWTARATVSSPSWATAR